MKKTTAAPIIRNKIFISSQNHGYVVTKVPSILRESHINLNDNIVTVFDSIEIIDKIQIELSFYKCVLDFYTVFPVTEETK